MRNHSTRHGASGKIRFGIYRADGTHKRPVMIHRALFGSIETLFRDSDRTFCRKIPFLAQPSASAHPDRCRSACTLCARTWPRDSKSAGFHVDVDSTQRIGEQKSEQCAACPSQLHLDGRRSRDRKSNAPTYEPAIMLSMEKFRSMNFINTSQKKRKQRAIDFSLFSST